MQMELSIERKTLSGSKTSFVFDYKRPRFVVKNFTDSDVYVSFSQSATDDKSIKIPSGMGQICMVTDEDHGIGIDTVYVKGTGEVEVQQL